MVSTLEHHTIPPLYACYLLNSINSRRQATYIGSTPDPPRRIKQHNGLLAGGAFKTKSGRPWNMELIVHGFPSKLQALQFEWAWQNPHASRHLRAPPSSATEPPKAHFPRTALSNRPLVKSQVLQLMLASPPWSSFNLEVTLFCGEAQGWWNEARRVGPVARTEGARRAWEKTQGSKGEQWGPWAKRIDRVKVNVVLDGVDGTRLTKGEVRVVEGRLEEAQDGAGKIEVHDGAFFDPHWSKWNARIANLEGSQSCCHLCRKYIDVHAHLDYLLCTVPTAPHSPSCAAIFHLPCLAQRFIARAWPVASTSTAQLPPLLPLDGHCPACAGALHWQDPIRGAYRREEMADGKGRKKPKRLVPLRGSQVVASSSQLEVEEGEEEEERFNLSDVGEEEGADEAERSFAFEQERSWAQMSDEDGEGIPFGDYECQAGMEVDNNWDDDGSSGILVFEPTPSPAPPTPRPRKAQDEMPRPAPRAKKARSPVQQTISARSTKPGLASSSSVKQPAKVVAVPARKVYTVLTSSDEEGGEEVEVAFRPVDLGGVATSSPDPEVAFEPVNLVTPTPSPAEGAAVVAEKGLGLGSVRLQAEEVDAVAAAVVARPKARRVGAKRKEAEVMVLSDSD